MKHKRKLRNRIKREVLHTIKKAKEKLEAEENLAKLRSDLRTGYLGRCGDYGMDEDQFKNWVLFLDYGYRI